MVESAFMEGLYFLLIAEYIYIERFVAPVPAVKKLITKSSTESVTDSKNPPEKQPSQAEPAISKHETTEKQIKIFFKINTSFFI